MDESIGPNKPFKDLADGLAGYGIASLRYDKRTFVYGAGSIPKGQELNLDIEVLLDARNAINYASNIDEIEQTFVLGHSLGGMLAPKIANENPEIYGIIMMAGNARPLEQLILEQYNYLFSDGGLSKAEKKKLVSIIGQVDNLQKLANNEDNTSLSLPLNLPASYWLDLLNYNQVEEIMKVDQKILILQGARDYQVTMEDYEHWQEALKENNKASFKSYPKLNHLFLEGEGPSYPKEYQEKGSIPDYVIKDIADWILRNN